MKKIKSMMLVALTCLALTACDSKESTINDLRTLQEQVSAGTKEWTTAEWKDFLAKYEEIESQLANYELTELEKEEVEKLKNKCKIYILKAKTKAAIGDVKDALNDARDAVDGAINNAIDEASGAVQEAVGTATDAVHGLLNDLQNK